MHATVTTRRRRTGAALLREWLDAPANTGSALAHELGIDQSNVSRWANGDAVPGREYWPLLEALTGIPGVAFLSGRALRAHERRELRLAQIRAMQAESAKGAAT